MCESLQAEQLALPRSVLDALTPQSEGFNKTPEYFATRMSVAFDAFSAVEAAAAQTSLFLFDTARFNRTAWQHARDAQQLGVDELLKQIFAATWQRDAIDGKVVAGEAVQLASNWVVLDAVLSMLDSGRLHPQAQAQVRQQLQVWALWLKKNPGRGTRR